MRPFATIIVALLFSASSASAADPPSRVGRIAWTEGEVAAWLESDRGWEKAYVNTPLTSENSLWTEPGARAEVRIGATAIRLDEVTQVDLRRLDDESLRAHVVRGSIAIRIGQFERGERYTLSTPQARFQLTASGRYGLYADETTEESRFTVFSGSAYLETSGRRVTISAGEAVRVYAEGGGFDFERATSNAFDDWALARDERLSHRPSSRYVSPWMTGHEDLDEYGEWTTEPDYGAVWYPTRVAVDWAPYRTGHWSWVRPWGWTWIDDSPWGYAPFHYGRWVYSGNRWGWTPGRYVARPVWAPALVAWVGSPGWSVSIRTGSAPVVGWYPLAPWDRYQPWYTNSPRYHDNVNVIVVRPPRDRDPRGRDPRGRDYDRDRDHNRVRGATIMLREGFVSRRPVASALAPVSRDVIAAQPVAPGASILPPRSEVPRSRPMTLGTPAPMPQAPVRGEAATPGRGQPARTPPASYPVTPSVAPSAPNAVVGGQPSGTQRSPARGEPAQSPGTATLPEARSKPAARADTFQPPSAPAPASPRAPAYRETQVPQSAPRAPVRQPAERAAPPQKEPRAQPQPQPEAKPIVTKPAREEGPEKPAKPVDDAPRGRGVRPQ